MSLARRVGAVIVVLHLSFLLGACSGQEVTSPASSQASAISRQAEAATGDWQRALTMADYSTVVEKSSGFYVVLVGAPWCGPCRSMSANVQLALDAWRSPVHQYGTVDGDAESELSSYLGIRGVPTTLLYRDGVLVSKRGGVISAAQIQSWMEQNGGYK